MGKLDRTTNINSNRYEALDGLRTYAAIGIVIMHVLSNLNIKPSDNYFTNTLIPWFTDFTLLFMVVSGFSVCCGYYNKIKNGTITPNEFYRKRYMRILPFFACLCLLDFIITPSIDQFYQLFANLTLCFNFIPNVNITMIGVGWFLGVVFAFYLLFPFYTFLLENKRRAWISMAFALILVGMTTIYSFNAEIASPNIGRGNILYCMPLFMIGGIIYLYRETLRFYATRRIIWLVLCIVCTIIFFMFLELRKSPFTLLISELILFAVWVIYAINSKDIILNNRFTKFISGISMEIYLCHMVIFRIIEKMHLEQYINDNNLLYVLVCIIVLGGAICFSYIMKKYALAFVLQRNK